MIAHQPLGCHMTLRNCLELRFVDSVSFLGMLWDHYIFMDLLYQAQGVSDARELPSLYRIDIGQREETRRDQGV